MVMLGDGTDISGAVTGLARGDGAWPQRGGRVEQGTAQVLQQPQPVAGHRQASPAAGGPVEHGPDQVRQLVSPGRRPMTLTRRRVSPKVRSMKLECRMRWSWAAGNWPVGGQPLPVGGQAFHRRRVGRGYRAAISLIRASMISVSFGPGAVFRPSVPNGPVGVLDLSLHPSRDAWPGCSAPGE